MKPWVVRESREVFSAPPWIRIFRQAVELPDGRIVSDYHTIDVGSHVVCLVQRDDGRMVFIRHYRHGPGQVALCLPAGGVAEGEEPLRAAQRELLEETGYEAQDWECLGDLTQHGNYKCGHAYFFRARQARQVAEPDSGDLEESEVVLLDREQIQDALRRGQFPMMGTVAALGLAFL